MSICQTCKHSKMMQLGTDGNAPIALVCKRYPPQIVGGILTGRGGPQSVGEPHWPRVQPEDGCGEHVPSPGLN